MRTTVLATVAAMAATSAMAQDPYNTSPIAFNGEVETTYNVDSEVFDITLTPELSYSLAPATTATMGTDLTVYNSGTEFILFDHTDTLPTLDFEVVHSMNDQWELNAEVSYDLNTEARSDLTLGATFAF